MRIFEKDGRSNIITTKPKFVYKNGLYDCFLWLSWWTKILLTLGLFGIKYAVFGSLYLLANTWVEQFAVAEESMCIFNVYNFSDAFAFAMETSLSVGFGSKYPNSECPPSILLVVLNFLFVGFITSQWCSVFLASYVASDNSSTYMFSNQAAITMIGNSLFLQIRVARPRFSSEMRSEREFGVRINAFLVSHAGEEEEARLSADEIIMNENPTFDVTFECESHRYDEDDLINLNVPTVLFHKINKTSPLYRMDADQLEASKIELVVEASTEGSLRYSRTSYTSKSVDFHKSH